MEYMTKCNKCNHDIEINWCYCPICGKKIKDAAAYISDYNHRSDSGISVIGEYYPPNYMRR